MNKKTPLQNFDLWETRRAKLVLLPIQNGNVTAAQANRFYFNSDGELDDAMILGVQVLSPNTSALGQFPTQSTYAPTVFDFYGGSSNIPFTKKFNSVWFVSLCDTFENYWWNRQAVGSLLPTNTGRYIKRTYNRIKLDKCFAETPVNVPISGLPTNSRGFIPFLFYYAPKKF